MHLVFLFNEPFGPEACWSNRSLDKCEVLILTTAANRDLDLQQGSHSCKLKAFTIEQSRHPLALSTTSGPISINSLL